MSELSPCVRCFVPYPREDLVRDKCPNCRAALRAVARQELMASDNRAIAAASRSLLNHIKKLGDDTAIMPEVAQSFLTSLSPTGDFKDGMKELGKCLNQDFQKARGYGLTEDEERVYERKEGSIVRYYQLIEAMLRNLDQNKQIDVSSLTDEDLSAALSQVAVQYMQTDPEFRRLVISQAIAATPDMRQEVMELGGQRVIEEAESAPVEQPEEDLEYDEYDPESEEEAEEEPEAESQ